MKLSARHRGISAIISACLLSVLMGVFIRLLEKKMGDFQQIYIRMIVGFFVGLFLYWRNLSFSKLKKINIKEWMLLFFRSFCFYVVGVVLFVKAYIEGKFSTVAFIQALPVSAILGFIVFKEKITIKRTLLVLFAFLGVVLVSVEDFSNLFVWGKGEIYSLISIIGFGIAFVSRRWHTKLLNDKEIALIMIFLSVGTIFILSLSKGETPIVWKDFVLFDFFCILAGGLINTFNLLFYNVGFKNLPSVTASNLLATEAVFALIVSMIFYREYPDWVQLAGGIVIILTAILINYSKKKSNAEKI